MTYGQLRQNAQQQALEWKRPDLTMNSLRVKYDHIKARNGVQPIQPEGTVVWKQSQARTLPPLSQEDLKLEYTYLSLRWSKTCSSTTFHKTRT